MKYQKGFIPIMVILVAFFIVGASGAGYTLYKDAKRSDELREAIDSFKKENPISRPSVKKVEPPSTTQTTNTIKSVPTKEKVVPQLAPTLNTTVVTTQPTTEERKCAEKYVQYQLSQADTIDSKIFEIGQGGDVGNPEFGVIHISKEGFGVPAIITMTKEEQQTLPGAIAISSTIGVDTISFQKACMYLEENGISY